MDYENLTLGALASEARKARAVIRDQQILLAKIKTVVARKSALKSVQGKLSKFTDAELKLLGIEKKGSSG